MRSYRKAVFFLIQIGFVLVALLGLVVTVEQSIEMLARTADSPSWPSALLGLLMSALALFGVAFVRLIQKWVEKIETRLIDLD